MLDRLLFAIDQYDSGQTALGFVASTARATNAEVRVLHFREFTKWARVPPLETVADAEHLVEEGVFCLRLAGVGAEGRTLSVPEDEIPRRIVDESRYWVCDAIVLGSRRLHGLEKLSGRGVRDRVLRLSPLPVIVAPAPATSRSHRPARRGSLTDGAHAQHTFQTQSSWTRPQMKSRGPVEQFNIRYSIGNERFFGRSRSLHGIPEDSCELP